MKTYTVSKEIVKKHRGFTAVYKWRVGENWSVQINIDKGGKITFCDLKTKSDCKKMVNDYKNKKLKLN